MPSRQRKSTDEDASTRALQAVERITGSEPIEDASEMIADPKLREEYREIMAKERARRVEKAAN